MDESSQISAFRKMQEFTAVSQIPEFCESCDGHEQFTAIIISH